MKDVKANNNILFKLEDENDISFEVADDKNEEFIEILQDNLQNYKDIAEEINTSKYVYEFSSSDEENSKIFRMKHMQI